MKKTIKKHRKKTSNIYIQLSFLFLSVIVASFIIISVHNRSSSSAPKSFAYSTSIFCPSPVPGTKNLQLKACYPLYSPTPVTFPTPFPMPTPIQVVQLTPNPQNPTSCGIAGGKLSGSLQLGKTNNGTCCVEDGPSHNAAECCPDAGGDNPSTGQFWGYPDWCDAKPVIYLYPQKRTTVHVSLKVPGTIPVSDPVYSVGGWKNIDAYPNGTFIYNNNMYKELFYEAAIKPITPPVNGVIIAQNQLQQTLTSLTTQLGLHQQEQQEFLAYWFPRLTQLHSPYLMISVFSPQQKDSIDHVDITPQPDTFIQFILYFKPIHQSYTLPPLRIPTPPQRTGFTAVEWGGIIDR